MPEIRIPDLDHIPEAAKKFSEIFKKYRIIAFYGEMGAGKTTFIKAICRHLQVKDEVNSPTFTIVNEYDSPFFSPIFHFDFYRIDSVNEVYEIGFWDYIERGSLIFFEWPEKIEDILPADCLKVYINTSESDERLVKWNS